MNVDATLVAQKPKVGPYIPEMRAKLAHVLGLPAEQVNVKATTEEGLGFFSTGGEWRLMRWRCWKKEHKVSQSSGSSAAGINKSEKSGGVYVAFSLLRGVSAAALSKTCRGTFCGRS